MFNFRCQNRDLSSSFSDGAKLYKRHEPHDVFSLIQVGKRIKQIGIKSVSAPTCQCLLPIYNIRPVTGSEAPMSEAKNIRILPSKPKMRPSWRSKVMRNTLSAADAF